MEYDVHRVVIAPETTDSEEILDVIRQVKQTGVKVSVLPRLFEVVGSSVEMDDIDGLTLLGIHRYGLTKSSEVLKRGMDVAGAALGLLLLSPVLARDRGRDQAHVPGPGAVPPAADRPRGTAVRAAQVPDDGRRRRCASSPT